VEIALKIVAKVVECVNDSKQFLIMDFIIPLRRLEGLGVVRDGVGTS